MADLTITAVHKCTQLCMSGAGLVDCKLFEPILMSATVERSECAIIQLTGVCLAA